MAAAGIHNPVLEAVSTTLARLPEARLGLVYGSAATGRLAAESDVDVAAAADGPLPWEQRLEWAGRLSDAAGRTVDLLDLHAAHGLILREALRGGRLVLCRDRALYASFIQRMLGEQEDFQPLLDRMLATRLSRWTRR